MTVIYITYGYFVFTDRYAYETNYYHYFVLIYVYIYVTERKTIFEIFG